MSCNEEFHSYLGGSAILKEGYKRYIKLIDIDGNKVQDFDMGRKSCFFLMGSDKKESDSSLISLLCFEIAKLSELFLAGFKIIASVCCLYLNFAAGSEALNFNS